MERSLTLGGRRANPNGKRIPAGEIERIVIDTLCGLCERPGELMEACGLTGAGAKSIDSVSQMAIGLKAELKDGAAQRRREILAGAVHRILLEDRRSSSRSAPPASAVCSASRETVSRTPFTGSRSP